MRSRWLLPPLLISLVVAAAGCGGGESTTGAGPPDRFDGARAFADLKAQVEIGPRPADSPGGRREVSLIRSRLRAADRSDVRVQSPLRNVVATVPGSEPGTIVLGAHWDTKDRPQGFVGADDGASGVAILLELARSLPPKLDGPSVQLVFFDGEEARDGNSFARDGTRGSRQYVRYAKRSIPSRAVQGAAPLDSIKAMVLFDMIGDCDLQVPFEQLSNRDLYLAFARAAKTLDGSAAPFTGVQEGILDDHIPFREAGVPALDLIDFDYGPGASPGAYWHTRADTLKHVCAKSLDAVGDAAIAALPNLNRR